MAYVSLLNLPRKSLVKKAGKSNSELEAIEKIISKSKLTQRDALELGRKIKIGIAKRHES